MKNWLTIGKFSAQTGFSTKALRLYEKRGLLPSHVRGDNGYRYYEESQLLVASRLKELKDLGFSLGEIKDLLKVDEGLNTDKMKSAMQVRLSFVSKQSEVLQTQKLQIENILSSLDQKSKPLKADQRRAIMTYYGNVSIFVTGCDGLQKTADFIQQHFKKSGQEVPVLQWSAEMRLPSEKPYILICPENLLGSSDITNINPDTVVIKNVSENSEDLREKYLNLYLQVGPHVTTVFNADDRASVVLAGNEQIKKGRIFYYSKNSGLEKQIEKIGGVIGDGEEIRLYGFTLHNKKIKLGRVLAFEEEIALMSSLGAILGLGFEENNLAL